MMHNCYWYCIDMDILNGDVNLTITWKATNIYQTRDWDIQVDGNKENEVVKGNVTEIVHTNVVRHTHQTYTLCGKMYQKQNNGLYRS